MSHDISKMTEDIGSLKAQSVLINNQLSEINSNQKEILSTMAEHAIKLALIDQKLQLHLTHGENKKKYHGAIYIAVLAALSSTLTYLIVNLVLRGLL